MMSLRFALGMVTFCLPIGFRRLMMLLAGTVELRVNFIARIDVTWARVTNQLKMRYED